MKGSRQVNKEEFLSLETIETLIVYVCIQRVNVQAKKCMCLWPVYGSGCQAHRCVKECNYDGVFTLNSFLVYQEWLTGENGAGGDGRRFTVS